MVTPTHLTRGNLHAFSKLQSPSLTANRPVTFDHPRGAFSPVIWRDLLNPMQSPPIFSLACFHIPPVESHIHPQPGSVSCRLLRYTWQSTGPTSQCLLLAFSGSMTPRILAAPQVFPSPTPRRTGQELIWGGSRPYPHTPSATSGNALACRSSPDLHQARLWMSLMVPLCISIKQGHHQSIGLLVYLGCCRVVILMLQV